MDSDELNAVMDAVTDDEARYDALDRLSEVVWAADDELLQRAVNLVRTNRDQFTP